jgi:glyoxylase-like metal-dependent hydrolase (beta-lactamase superfamily II)
VGDLLAQRFGLRLPSIPFTADTARAIKSVKKLAKEEFDVICFGHGLPLKHGARNRVVEFASRLNRNVKSER